MKGVAFFLFALCFVTACTSTKADVQTICDSSRVALLDKRPELTNDEERLVFLFEWSAHNIWTDGGRALLAQLQNASLPWSAKSTRLREAAVANGIARCSLAKWIDVRTDEGATKASP